MADITETRRKKLLAHLAEEGGQLEIGPLHEWSGLKLLATHKPFSDLMEGLTSDGLVTWDGKVFTITDEGRKLAATAKKPSAKKKAAAPVDATPPAPAEREPAHEHAHAHAHAHEPAPEPEHAHEHAHAHEHEHDHEHRHGQGPAGPPPEVGYARRADPPPSAPPPPKGLRARIKARLKKLVGLA